MSNHYKDESVYFGDRRGGSGIVRRVRNGASGQVVVCGTAMQAEDPEVAPEKVWATSLGGQWEILSKHVPALN